MHDTPPPPPPADRDTETLLDDLCIALRNVGCADYELPAGQRVLKALQAVRAIHDELARRDVDPGERVTRLSEETRWRMTDLLRDCLAFPDVVPYVRDRDGIRRHLRCGRCRAAERPPDAAQFPFCDACLERVRSAIERREPADGVVLFRTYNAECRCGHADDDTVLASIGWTDDDAIFGNCVRCLDEELARRRGPEIS